MTSTLKIKTAEALFPLLSAFHEVDGALLESVRLVRTEGMITQLALQLGSKVLVIRAEAEDDTADLTIQSVIPDGEMVNDHQPWSEVIGKQIGWGWVMVNQQGYLDGVLLSFGGVVPEILVAVVASGLLVKRVC